MCHVSQNLINGEVYTKSELECLSSNGHMVIHTKMKLCTQTNLFLNFADKHHCLVAILHNSHNHCNIDENEAIS